MGDACTNTSIYEITKMGYLRGTKNGPNYGIFDLFQFLTIKFLDSNFLSTSNFWISDFLDLDQNLGFEISNHNFKIPKMAQN